MRLPFVSSVLLLVVLTTGVWAQEEDLLAKHLPMAQQGDAAAQNEVGIIYAEGLGVKRDDREGVRWFRKSAAQGNVFGACNLALHYGRGEGVHKNLTLMMKWSLIAHSLDSLKCHPEDFVEAFKPGKTQIRRSWQMALAWLRAHPELDNDFGERPWLRQGDWPITYRERGPAQAKRRALRRR